MAQRWLLVPPDIDLPPEWQARATILKLIPLGPDEMDRLSGPAGDVRGTSFLQLVARGLPAYEIARATGMTARSVYRRLARLRDRYGVETNSELGTELARQGF